MRVKYAFGFLQITTDDDPASAIDYVKESNWKHLDWKNGSALLPDFYGNSSHLKVHTLLDHANVKSLELYIANQDFEALRKGSFSVQKRVYSDILNRQQDYTKCCPEYLDQANGFFKKSLGDFKTYTDLSLELYLASSTIEVKGKTADGRPFSNWIVCK